MDLPDEPTLLQTVLANAPLAEDPQRAWAFMIFCGLLDTTAHADFVRLAGEKAGDPLALADALLDAATARAELVDRRQELALRLWQYFQVGQSLEPEREEGTNPGVTSPGEPT